MKHELDKLDKEFKALWLKTERLPKALQQWQEKLQDLVERSDANTKNVKVLSQYADSWQDIIDKNNALFSEQKNKLQQQLKIGELSYTKEKQAGKFKQEGDQ
ncbi:hypothetical protein [Reinekea thalattae]|uniref:Uncharacterized protein n=1 Tax=Reinekea thalattae TaxID=2593301 RepID=A0A5C8Z7G2_9GAMM|nr:hypothetical protein [Reinekea thalattae]TXR53244.1 hypothetical protein FME95_01330 [Reinekea thalattae]